MRSARVVGTGKSRNAYEHESARSDKLTGGVIERAALVEGDPDIRITVDVPAFRLTLWQSGSVVKTYPVGIGLYEFPLPVGSRTASAIVWNPSWIPPRSDWVNEAKGRVRPGEVITAADPRNPLGKIKIPLGNGHLIHQARGAGDLGNLVSHGCVRMLQADIYDLAAKIVRARALPVSIEEIERTKRTTRTLDVEFDTPLPVDIAYDTQVVEAGILNLYHDVYNRGTNTVARLRDELAANGVRASSLDDATLESLLLRPTRTQKFVVPLASIKRGRALLDGKLQPLVASPAPAKPSVRVAKTARRTPRLRRQE